RVLILAGVHMGGHKGADREGVLHYRQRAAGVLAPQLEDDADGAKIPGTALAWADDGQGWGLGPGHRGAPLSLAVPMNTAVQWNCPPSSAGCQELSEHQRLPNSRPYRMRKRAEQVDQTRQCIVEAAGQLHGTVGARRTTIAGIAEQAGVARLPGE